MSCSACVASLTPDGKALSRCLKKHHKLADSLCPQCIADTVSDEVLAEVVTAEKEYKKEHSKYRVIDVVKLVHTVRPSPKTRAKAVKVIEKLEAKDNLSKEEKKTLQQERDLLKIIKETDAAHEEHIARMEIVRRAHNNIFEYLRIGEISGMC
jgi:hypothetical protein